MDTNNFNSKTAKSPVSDESQTAKRSRRSIVFHYTLWVTLILFMPQSHTEVSKNNANPSRTDNINVALLISTSALSTVNSSASPTVSPATNIISSTPNNTSSTPNNTLLAANNTLPTADSSTLQKTNIFDSIFKMASPRVESGGEIFSRLNSEVKNTLNELFQQSTSSERLAKSATALLVFPNIIKAAIGIGGEYGEGVLVINNKIADYYSVKGLSLGIQFGVHSKSLVIIFLKPEDLNYFRIHSGWKMGIDGALTMASLGVAGELDSLTSRKSSIGYVFNSRGLIYDVSIKGAKFTRLPKEKFEDSHVIALDTTVTSIQ